MIVTAAIWFLMNRTVHGRNAYAIGNNREAAVNAGIRVGPHMMINFMIHWLFGRALRPWCSIRNPDR